jgi:predicted transcriptional regulator
MNYRDRLNIIADILTVTSRTAKRTQIMYQANLSYKVLRRYLDEVVSAALVSFEDEKQCYVLTEKGKTFLSVYREYIKTSRGIKKRLDAARKKKRTLEMLCENGKETNHLTAGVA